MEKLALYRKYRPQNFENLVGQDHIRSTLINAFKSGHISHAYLFSGPRGTGKTSTARLVAKAINCQNLRDDYEPCDKCDLCREINEGRLIDIIEIDAASNRGIDEVRDLKEKIAFFPTRAKCKVYIIDEVHMMTKEAFNALLKTLEEPPSHCYFILATTEIHKIPDTIISRCQRFDFKRIANLHLFERLMEIAGKENIKIEEKALQAIVKHAKGGLRDAIGLLEQLKQDGMITFAHIQEILGISDMSLLEQMFELLMKKATRPALDLVQNIYDQGSNLRQFFEEFVEMLRDKMLESAEKGVGVFELIEMITAFQEANQKVDQLLPQLPYEIAVISLTSQKPEKNHQITIEENLESVVRADERAEKNPNQEINEASGEMESLKIQWANFIEQIKNPALRMSMKGAKLAQIEENEVFLEFASNFHRDKVLEHDHRLELEAFLKDVLKREVKISASVKELELRPKPLGGKQTKEQDQTVEAKADSLTVTAMDIFGGELI